MNMSAFGAPSPSGWVLLLVIIPALFGANKNLLNWRRTGHKASTNFAKRQNTLTRNSSHWAERKSVRPNSRTDIRSTVSIHKCLMGGHKQSIIRVGTQCARNVFISKYENRHYPTNNEQPTNRIHQSLIGSSSDHIRGRAAPGKSQRASRRVLRAIHRSSGSCAERKKWKY